MNHSKSFNLLWSVLFSYNVRCNVVVFRCTRLHETEPDCGHALCGQSSSGVYPLAGMSGDKRTETVEDQIYTSNGSINKHTSLKISTIFL